MKSISNIITVLLAFVIISGQHSILTVIPGEASVHIQIDQITDDVVISTSWADIDGAIWIDGKLELAPGRYDEHSGHSIYVPWGCSLGTGEHMLMFPATEVRVETSDGGDSGWLLLDQ